MYGSLYTLTQYGTLLASAPTYANARAVLALAAREHKVTNAGVRIAFSTYLTHQWRDKGHADFKHGEYVIRLFDTDIVTFHRDGTVTLNTGGWNTIVTRDAMSHFSPFHVYSDKKQTCVRPRGDGGWKDATYTLSDAPRRFKQNGTPLDGYTLYQRATAKRGTTSCGYGCPCTSCGKTQMQVA